MTPTNSTTERPVIYADRLDFVLKSFVRVAWASPIAERIWSSRFERIRSAIIRVEWMSVCRKQRPCALFRLQSAQIESCSALWSREGLAWRTLGGSMPHSGAWWLDSSIARNATSQPVAVGNNVDLAAFGRAWDAEDHGAIGELLGYPHCCRTFFIEVAEKQQCIDTVWAMSERQPRIEGRECSRSVEGRAASNILLQSCGLRAVPHMPCSVDCRATVRSAEVLSDIAVETDAEEEYGWLSNVLSWPAEWSALHGIAEVKTPILKLCVPTDATAGEYVVRWSGSVMPAEAAKGIGFPYKASGRLPAAARITRPEYRP
jgi:hypothetical protein